MEKQLNLCGVTFNFSVEGEGKPVVLMHGWGCNRTTLARIEQLLVPHFKVYNVDFPGFGKSSEPTSVWGIEDYTHLFEEFLKAEKIENPILLGHSFGGRVAVRLTRKYPQYVRKLVLIDAAGLRPRFSLMRFARVVLHKLRRAAGLKGLNGSHDYAALSGAMKGTFVNIVNDHTDKDLRYVSSGALILWGKRDKDTPLYMAKRFLRHIKNSSLIIFPDAGHYSYLDAFNETLFALKAYIG